MSLLLNICVDEEGVCLRVDIFHHDLETVEASSLWHLNFVAEALEEVLVDNTVRRGEEGKDVGDEVSLVVVESVVPVVKILGEVDLLCGPERCLRFLIHLPDLLQSR